MITQGLLDFLRDFILNWIVGVNALMSGMDAAAAGAAIGGVAAVAGHILTLFISNSVWGAVVTTWAAWLSVWLTTGLIAIISRRGKAS